MRNHVNKRAVARDNPPKAKVWASTLNFEHRGLKSIIELREGEGMAVAGAGVIIISGLGMMIFAFCFSRRFAGFPEMHV
jgi:hypothetical protein